MRSEVNKLNSVMALSTFSLGQVTDQPTMRGYRVALVATCLYMIAVSIIVPFGDMRAPEMPGLIPFLNAVVITTDLSTGFLLLVMFHEMHRVSLLILSGAYLYAASMATLNLLTFPGVLLRDSVALGTSQSAAWAILSFWVGYGILSFAAMLVECFAHTRTIGRNKIGLAISVSLILMLALICGISLMTIRFVDLLPPLIQGSAFTNVTLLPRRFSIALMLVTVVLGLFIAGRRSSIFLWLSLAITATLCVNILTLTSGGRGTLGWSLGRVSWMLSASVLFLFFMVQFARQLRFLARSKDLLEQRVQERTADLTRALQQRDLLLREVYHRVKNNMQVIDSMLFLERRRIADSPTKDMIDVLRQRVYALGLVHQQLMSSDNLEYFDIAPFMRELVHNLGVSEAIQERGIKLEVKSEEVLVNLDVAISLGLLTAELVTNSLKHANAQHISIVFQGSRDGSACLTVEDDGTDTETIDAKSTGSVLSGGQGSLIIASLVAQLDGRLEVTRDIGMRVEIVMPMPTRGQI
jgi:two-component sensor histidine kinase